MTKSVAADAKSNGVPAPRTGAGTTPADTPAAAEHPLDPLAADEILAARRLVLDALELGDGHRFALVQLHEPPKQEVLSHRPGDPVDRRLLVVSLDRATGDVHETVVSVTHRRVLQTAAVPTGEPPYGQPPVLIEEFFAVEEIVKADPQWRAAVRRRGVTNIALVQVDPFSAGQFDFEAERGRRLIRAISYARTHPTDNAYAHPIEGLIAYVDVNAGEVIELIDEQPVPLALAHGNYDEQAVGPARTSLRPLDIVQPEGPSFTVDGNRVEWEHWSFRVSLDPREGLVLHLLSFEDGGRERPVIYRASIAEMVVPYADPRPAHFWRSAFDAGEYGLGKLANSLELGCDCLGEIHYFDAVLADDEGRPQEIRNAICLHEEDHGILWKHFDFRNETSEVRRSRRLVVSFFATVGNYDYGFYWYLYQDGSIEFEAKLTGIVLTTGVRKGQDYAHGALIADRLAAPYHQHFFCARLDMTVDGPRNSIVEVEVGPVPPGLGNPHGNAFATTTRPLASEAQAKRSANPARGRIWKIVNPSSRNAVGEPVGFTLVPHGGPTLLAQPDSALARRAAFATRNLWVTRYQPDERYPAGDYPNQHLGGGGLADWTRQDRSLDDEDIVVWHTFGSTHLPRPEDWPVMPVEHVGFSLKPTGFFDRNPALDLPSPGTPHCHHDDR